MKIRFLPPVLCVLLLTSCAHNSWHSPSKPAIEAVAIATKQDKSRVHILYKEYGHYNTAAVVARIAGYKPEDAARLACFTQAPDDLLLSHNAVPVAFWGALPPFWGYRQRIMSTLHSLHGGNDREVMERRARLAELIYKMDKHDPAEQWKVGFLIHALGDSYAHVYEVAPGKVNAYGPIVGHGLDGDKVGPDNISRHLGTYHGYVHGLYGALGGDGTPAQVQKIDAFVAGVTNAAGSYQCPKEAEKAVKAFIIQECLNLGVPGTSESLGAWRREINCSEVNKFLKRLEKKLEASQPL